MIKAVTMQRDHRDDMCQPKSVLRVLRFSQLIVIDNILFNIFLLKDSMLSPWNFILQWCNSAYIHLCPCTHVCICAYIGIQASLRLKNKPMWLGTQFCTKSKTIYYSLIFNFLRQGFHVAQAGPQFSMQQHDPEPLGLLSPLPSAGITVWASMSFRNKRVLS